MRKIFLFFIAALFSVSMWADKQGGALTSSTTPIDPSETTTLTYSKNGSFSGWTPKLFIHAYLQAVDGKTFSKEYTTDWNACTCEGDADYYALDDKYKLVDQDANTSTLLINIKSFFDVADEDLLKIGRMVVVVRAQWSGENNQTVDFSLAVSGRYYMRNSWNAGEWSWKEMTKDGSNFKLENVAFGGLGVNYGREESDGTWVASSDFEGAAIGMGDIVNLVLDPSTGTITSTLVTQYDGDIYMKNNWDGTNWTWKKMTKVSAGIYKLENVIYRGSTVNYNTTADDSGRIDVAPENFVNDDGAAVWALVDLQLDLHAETVTMTLNKASIQLHGSFANPEAPGTWADYGDVFAIYGSTASYSASLTGGKEYRFKIKRAGTELLGINNGDKGDYELKSDWTSASPVGDGDDALKLITTKTGAYTFTWTYATSTLSVVFPTETALDNTDASTKAVKRIVNGQLVIEREGKLFNALGAEVK